MEALIILVVVFGALLAFLATGLPVAFCFFAINALVAVIALGFDAGLNTLVLSIYASLNLFTLVAVPMFLLMGEVTFHSGVGTRMINALDAWLGRMPGRLGLLAVAAATIFATLSGSSMATTALLGTVLVPEMVSRGYNKRMCAGPILASGGIAMMIPPSSLGVLLATLAKISVAKLLIGGIIPGLIMGGLYAGYIIVKSWRNPSIAPPYDVARISLPKKTALFFRDVVPLGSIIFLVIGLMLLGVATPSEAAGMGALGCFALAAAYGGFNWAMVKKSVIGTLKVTIMVFTIIAGSTAYSQILAFSGASAGLLKLAQDFPIHPVFLLIIMQIFLLILGCLMDNLSIMMITIPIYMPIVQALGWDPIWFSILLLVNVETGLITPPFGLNLFVMKGVAPPNMTMTEVYKASFPYIVCNLLVIALLIAFPQIALWLPNTIK